MKIRGKIIVITGASSGIAEGNLFIVGQKAVRLASSYEYVVTMLREKMIEYIRSSYSLLCCTKSCELAFEWIPRNCKSIQRSKDDLFIVFLFHLRFDFVHSSQTTNLSA